MKPPMNAIGEEKILLVFFFICVHLRPSAVQDTWIPAFAGMTAHGCA
jgi:hypothetical protein